MNFKRIINQKLYAFIIILLVINLLFGTGSSLFTKISEVKNQKIIDSTIGTKTTEEPKSQPVSADKVYELLKLPSLTQRQKCDIYNELALDLYINNRIPEFLELIGYAIFYNEVCGKVEQSVYYYALLSQYYLELGADKSAYEIILTARRNRNFYSLEDPLIRGQALHAYGRFLLSESDFSDAKKAQAQMEEDAGIVSQTLPLLGENLTKRALAFKAYIMLQEGKADAASSLADELLSRYYSPELENDHITVYDFLLPLYLIKTQHALRKGDYKSAIDFNNQYGHVAKKFDFLQKKINLSKDVMFFLPTDMISEREEVYNELSRDTDLLAQKLLDDYTSITGEKLFATINNLKFKSERDTTNRRIRNNLFFAVSVLCIFMLILLAVYSETQIDGLTKLRNRRSLNIRIGRLASAGKKYSAIMIDIDNFKHLNDNFGHAFGDEVLKGISAFLISCEAHNVRCYRYGGEEMVVLLEHFDLEHAVRLSEHIRNEISMMKWSKDVHVTASFGLGFEMPDSLKEADENMYVAKQKGKNFTAYKKDGVQYLAERRLDIRQPISDKI